MKPLFFDGCFGWYHAAVGTRAVVLCSSFGHEDIWAHKGLHQLANRLAESGIPALRFDYPDSGDSARLDGRISRPQGWMHGIARAVEQVKALSGATEVVLCGLRIGATLAATIAREVDARALVMLAPLASGKPFLREVRMVQHTWLQSASPEVRAHYPTDATHLEVLGYDYDADSVDYLTALDLLRGTALPAAEILLADAGGRHAGKLAAHYTELGARVDVVPFGGYGEFMQEPIFSVVPDALFDTVVEWIAALAPAARRAVPHPAATVGYSGSARLNTGLGIEHPVRFGDGLFGMLSEPRTPRPDLPVVLFLNPGATHHVGAGRLYVSFARRLAASGIVSLRADVNGIGDAIEAGRRGSARPLYSNQACAEAADAVNWLSSHTKRQVVILGISAGAYLGLHAALSNPQVAGLFLINLPRFLWPEGMTLPRSVMLGQPDAQQFDSAPASSAETRAEIALVEKMASQLGTQRVRTQLLYSPADPGMRQLEKLFGPNGRDLQTLADVHCCVIDNMDHGVLSPFARADIMGLFESFLASECASTADRNAPDARRHQMA